MDWSTETLLGTSTPEVCHDTIDNDGDKLIDAADPDCQTPPEECNDTIDNDGDTLTDAADPDCQTVPIYQFLQLKPTVFNLVIHLKML